MTLTFPFASPAVFEACFLEGLERQLDDGALGAFILVLANATFEQRLWERLRGRVADHLELRAGELRTALQSGGSLAASQDDQLVFLKLLAIGLDHLDVTQLRRPENWEVQYNLVRGLRPARMADQVAESIRAPFEPHCFNFGLPDLAKELFWQGMLHGRETRFFYNKFPFVSGHLLMVPDTLAFHPQFLRRDMLDFAWRFLDEAGVGLPGIGAGYNSYGALASVNHLHFQVFVRERALPVEAEYWAHNGGAESYPAEVVVCGSAREAWRVLSAAHEEDQAYNLVLRPGIAYVLPRRLQGSYEPAAWASGHAWYEMAGGAVLTRRAAFEALDGPALSAELAKIGGAASELTASS